MKVSRNWLQKYFDASLPSAEALAEALTFHSSEVEDPPADGKGDMLDVNVLPDRAAYILSHRGIAYELAAALDIALKNDPLRTPVPIVPASSELSVTACDPLLVPRYMGALIRGVKIGPSPEWLKDAIESIGQRSINNVVDAANYVMLDIGQPLHAFDAKKLSNKNGAYAITVRKAYEGEKITTLTGEEYLLPEGTLLIADGHSDAALGIAGVKGGKSAEVDANTTDIIIESANFDAMTTRRASQALKLWTEASLRFQNQLSPELAGYGMRDVLALVTQVAGGEVVGVTDNYSSPPSALTITATVGRLNRVLGTTYNAEDVTGAFDRLSLKYRKDDESFVVTPPFERRDLTLPEDLAEEVGRVLGYENLETPELPLVEKPPDRRRYNGIEKLKDILLERGYIEISTPSFTEVGDTLLANPLQMDRPWLRSALAGNMQGALLRAKREAPRTLGPDPRLKLFEIGTVFTEKDEHFSLALGYEQIAGKPSTSILDEDIDALIDGTPNSGLVKPEHDGTVAEISLAGVDLEKAGEGYEPKKIILGPYRPYSVYPFALRDIAVWTSEATEESEVALLIEREAGELLARLDLFDRFEKDGRTSYAFRLVFEASDRTLSDADLDPVMERVTSALNARDGWEVR